MNNLILVVKPVKRGQYMAELNGRVLCTSRQPFLDGARVLLAEGMEPSTRVVMRHYGSTTDSLSALVGEAAKLTVREDERYAARFSKWKPFSQTVPHSGAGQPLAGLNAGEVP